ncbi:glycoside hydrolase family 66 protein [Cohnella fermenti]|uniref:Dextranase n=1 Tax=Cohnella fermenti TaxID=2565925 RepID=A0A4S4BHH8_9BACL|nr:glycoside hydrolase family 66 protein [Cohnella fermenti]THF74000.1 hypothetical protein E6C55_26850 [Cohnella fermenti]
MSKNDTIDVIPNKAQYKPGEEVRLRFRDGGGRSLAGWSYEFVLMDQNRPIRTGTGDCTADIYLEPVGEGSGAYGVFLTMNGPGGELASAETAFDVAEHWREAPRYGFLSDFAPEEEGDEEDVEFLNRSHINVVQFYDWMYRHDRLLTKEEPFVDPLGRRLSHRVVREKIEALRIRGIASLAYAAVYGALPDYVKEHPEQALYQNNGRAYSLGGFFYIMDISSDSDWTRHLLGQLEEALEGMGFDGFHLDQYGFPKKAIRKARGGDEVVRLKDLYPSFINQVRERVSVLRPDAGLIFNNVSNYPVHTTAGADQDVIYIEVWDPVTQLRDVKQIIDWARMLSGKQVVLAAYLPAFHPDKGIDPHQAEIGARLAMGTIFASGGYHLLLGERESVLADSYYPKYGAMTDSLRSVVQRHYDFIVMYRGLLFDHELDDISMTYSGGINTEVVVSKEGVAFTPVGRPGAVWTIVKEKPGYLIVHLLNLDGVSDDSWHSAKEREPTPLAGIEIRAELWEEIEHVYWATPDGDSIRPEELRHERIAREGEGEGGDRIRVVLPSLLYWSMVVLKTKPGMPMGLVQE